MKKDTCQIHDLEKMSEPLSIVDLVGQRKNRVTRFVKRRWNYLKNMLSETAARTIRDSAHTAARAGNGLQPGDRVRVKSRAEIQQTLNLWNQLRGCSFMEEMTPYCGTEQKVLKRIEKFLDERDYLIKKCKGIVILDGVFCTGTKHFGDCDRTCFFFWREDWLEKIDGTAK